MASSKAHVVELQAGMVRRKCKYDEILRQFHYYCIFSTVGQIAIASLAAYAFAKIQFKGKILCS